MKKVWKVFSTVTVWLIVMVAVFMMIFTIVSVNTFNRNDRNFMGMRFYVVLSDSMSKTDFDAGDLVVWCVDLCSSCYYWGKTLLCVYF